MKRLIVAALASLGLLYLVFSPIPTEGRTPGTVELLWMSAVSYNGQFCVGPLGWHNSTALDVLADDDGSICTTTPNPDSMMWVYINTWGWADTTHKIASAWVVDGVYSDNCDYLEAQTVGIDSKLRGTERYVHSRDLPASYWYDIWAAPEPYGRTQSRNAGYTVADTDCPWTAHHVHQASSSNCSLNGGLRAGDIKPVWNVFNFVHKYIWREGQNC